MNQNLWVKGWYLNHPVCSIPMRTAVHFLCPKENCMILHQFAMQAKMRCPTIRCERVGVIKANELKSTNCKKSEKKRSLICLILRMSCGFYWLSKGDVKKCHLAIKCRRIFPKLACPLCISSLTFFFCQQYLGGLTSCAYAIL